MEWNCILDLIIEVLWTFLYRNTVFILFQHLFCKQLFKVCCLFRHLERFYFECLEKIFDPLLTFICPTRRFLSFFFIFLFFLPQQHFQKFPINCKIKKTLTLISGWHFPTVCSFDRYFSEEYNSGLEQYSFSPVPVNSLVVLIFPKQFCRGIFN